MAGRDFFAAAPLREPGKLSADVEKQYWRSRTARLSLLRVIAIVVGLAWCAALIFGRVGHETRAVWRAGDLDSVIGLLMLVQLGAAATVLAAGFVNRLKFYIRLFRLASLTYLAILGVHAVLMLLTGQSPLSELHLVDYGGLPLALLVATLPMRTGLVLVVVVLAVSVLTEPNTAFGHSMVLAWGNAVLTVLPFTLMINAALKTTTIIDRLATRRHQEALVVARSRALAEVEARLLGYLHDQVLQQLGGIRRGVVPAVPFEVALPEQPGAAGERPLTDVLVDLVDTLSILNPGMRIDLPAEIPDCLVPADAMSSITDATLEAVNNCLEHAPDAGHRCSVRFSVDGQGRCTGVSVIIADDGPGFDLESVPADSAGIKISLLARMSSTRGCSAEVDTAPGEGTTVILSWDAARARQTEAQPDPLGRSTQELFGLGRVFNPLYATFASLFFLGAGLFNDHSQQPWLFLLALACAVGAMFGLVRGDELKLSLPATVLVAALIIGFWVLAVTEDIPTEEAWPHLWYPWVLILLLTYLAMRDRAIFAWGTWGLVVAAAHFLDIRPALLGEVDPVATIYVSALLPATFLPVALNLATQALPTALETQGNRATALGVATTQRDYLTSSATWLNAQLRTALDPALPEETRRQRAQLLELRLRDSIRSPLLDDPAITRAIWQARAVGVSVSLRDDRSDERGVDKHADPEAWSGLKEWLLQALADPVNRSVTVRILPPGRRLYASLVVSTGDEETVERLEVPAGQRV